MKKGTYTATLKWLPDLVKGASPSIKIKIDRKYIARPKDNIGVPIPDRVEAVKESK